MIDSHAHLEQPQFSRDRDRVIEKCKKAGLKAIVTSCAHPKDLDLTLEMVEKWKNFVFATVGVHPEFIKEIKQKEIESFLDLIKENEKRIIGIGETGLDYWWTKEKPWQEKQKELFIQLINFAGELKKPLVIHSREASDDAVKILEQGDAKGVLMHMFGANDLVKRVEENGWYVSLNTIILRSKKHKKVARDMPLEKILLETDSPWLAPMEWGQKKRGGGSQSGRGPLVRNDPTSIKIVAEKIAEIKKISFESVWSQCAKNAIGFFKLPFQSL